MHRLRSPYLSETNKKERDVHVVWNTNQTGRNKVNVDYKRSKWKREIKKKYICEIKDPNQKVNWLWMIPIQMKVDRQIFNKHGQ